ncbi:nucleotide sugar dehydrogenase [Nocardioides perillae]|uniref:Nucleotide sugar dehydrogenase n=1 Tax=Nocardioides perillae TaxID=1119534 RepID=A0A7Y9UJW9_9ACTN|nr:nucleotide sugar dehydrogenase [Nocardioides perillae]NYG54703.1 nucleotide sugar dehydrogenase [Nocardioides perillae]
MYQFGVVGLGYVGLPLAHAAVEAGLRGVGVDASSAVVDGLRSGRSHVDDLDDAQVAGMLGRGFVATVDPSPLASCEVIVICVPTPLSDEGGPDLTAVRAAAEMVRDNLRTGALVILESTTWPGTTEELLQPILESRGAQAGVDFHLAYSPERIDPGNPTFNVRNTPKVVGGVTSQCREKATAFYAQFVDTIVPAAGTREAEMAKLLENTYRQVNIALVNEMAKFSRELGIDIWNVISCAATKPFGYQAFHPGPGVGGHCIPIDPSYLSHRVQAELGYPFRFVELAQEVNRSMPRYVRDRAQALLNDRGLPIRGSKILILGVTYKAGISDQRESPAIPLARQLLSLGAELQFYDPFVQEWKAPGVTLARVLDVELALRECDLAIVMQPHQSYGPDVLNRSRAFVLDARGSSQGDRIEKL